MIKYIKYKLDNGLKVILHQNNKIKSITINTLYNVGAKDESKNKTGFAHLFEHLMFGGSENISDFDLHVEKIGGSNNAFTNNDFTNYYITVPSVNIETALWLESDRMNKLAFSEKSLETQRKVVIEEFKQNYLNKPFGDVWFIIRKMLYNNNNYSWPTIGKDISHIENATMEDVKDFYSKYYNPNNAILSISGNFEIDEIKSLIYKYYANIENTNNFKRKKIKIKKQNEIVEKKVKRNVKKRKIFILYKICKKSNKDFFALDILSDIYGYGDSSVLYQKYVIQNPVFTTISCYIQDNLESGLFVISATLSENTKFNKAKKLIHKVFNKKFIEKIENNTIERAKNKLVTYKKFEELSNENIAYELALNYHIGKTKWINKQNEYYNSINAKQLLNIFEKYLYIENSTTLKYDINKQLAKND